MDRKAFIQRTCQLGMASLFVRQATPVAAQAEKESPDSPEERFKQAWVVTLMESMERQMDEGSRVRLMEACGRSCARRGGILKLAESCKGNLSKFVETVGPQLAKELNFIEGNVVHWGYPRCFCELVAKGKGTLPATYCFCSVGWVKEVFETVVGKPVTVELVQSVKRGADSCRFLVRT